MRDRSFKPRRHRASFVNDWNLGSRRLSYLTRDPDPIASALKVTRDNPCSVLFPSEVGEFLGAKADMREVVDEVTCRYHFQPPTQRKTTSDEETFIEVKAEATSIYLHLSRRHLEKTIKPLEYLSVSGVGEANHFYHRQRQK